MRHSAITVISTIVLAGLTSVTTAEVGNPAWTGGAKTCSFGNQDWSDVDNWEDAGGISPNSGAVDLQGVVVCDPCDQGQCNPPRGGCLPPPDPCQYYCDGGFREGLPCDDQGDCPSCGGGSWTAIYDCMVFDDPCLGDDEEPDLFTTIRVESDDDHTMTLRKTGNRVMQASNALWLKGYSSNAAILDIQQTGAKPSDLIACGQVEIMLATSKTLEVTDQFLVGACTLQTVAKVTGAGTLNVYEFGDKTTVTHSGSNTSTLELYTGLRSLGTLQVSGGDGAGQLAKFYHVTGTVDHVEHVRMRGHSTIQVDPTTEDYFIDDDLTVDTGNDPTVANISMGAAARRFQADNIIITSGASDNATLTMNAGILACPNGTLTITGGATTTAKLDILFAAGTPDLANITLNARGALILNHDVNINDHDGQLKLEADSVSGSELKIATDNMELTVDRLTVKGGVKYDPDLASGAKILTAL